ncbi:MAG: Holliday junction resolvase RuvX [Bacteroidia bacterium]|nr:Holliday junction resolvase RuvX [Bacteroidia bacterium]MDW8134446.1 Holliday junction resolvase RuvX [Bacteroidia bacterium]
MKRILAIDYGQKRTGLAWTDKEQKVPLPLETIDTAKIWERLPHLIPEVELVIVGYPRRLDGRPTDMTGPVGNFVRLFRQRFPAIPLQLVEERLSTQAALHYIQALPQALRRDKGIQDQIAAAVLLDTYLIRTRR